MNKVLTILLVVLLSVFLMGCGDDDEGSGTINPHSGNSAPFRVLAGVYSPYLTILSVPIGERTFTCIWAVDYYSAGGFWCYEGEGYGH